MGKIWPIVLVALLLLVGCAGSAPGGQPAGETEPAAGALHGKLEPVDIAGLELPVGQMLYVPAYSEIYDADETQTFNLSIMLSIRNTDLNRSIIIESVRYYNSDGDLVREYVESPLALAPMATGEVAISRVDKTGGTGANFIVVWSATETVHEPVVEALMTSTSQQQGLSFLSVATVLESRP
ncbi:MAG: DUF3124 domain-containing protein [Caldilineaceae bacterium]|nr:DUF3124 domain-containing protein [Caldilineaceae bacterium]MCB9137145.1 DUF3124 domain-containing protein [Caldilineaceae bacterium]